MSKTPITLITGSLGSGKTTLLRRILDNPPVRFAVLMNEFGELAIDSQVIRGKNIEMIELVGGCVCCSLTGEFEAAVREILEKFHPEWILLEATGVAEADALVFDVQDHIPGVRLDSVIYIVDAYFTRQFPEIGYVMRTQLQAADVILINKIDLLKLEDTAAIEERLKKFNDKALILQSQRCSVDIELLFGLNVEKKIKPLASVADKHHDLDFEAFTFSSERILSRERFERLMADLPSAVFRAKGFVCLSNGTFLFNAVMGRWELEEFSAQKTELVFIGPSVNQIQEKIVKELRNCEMVN